jgi:hypothetical protein
VYKYFYGNAVGNKKDVLLRIFMSYVQAWAKVQWDNEVEKRTLIKE